MAEMLDIVDLGANGDGVARSPDGEVIFVPLAVPGDRVMAEIERHQNGAAYARLMEIMEPGPDRVPPPCRHFGLCGGCALQHLSGDAYKAFKRHALIQTFERVGIILPETMRGIFIPDRTRRRANFASRIVNGHAVIGFHERRSAAVRDVPDCLIINDHVRDVMESFRTCLPHIADAGQKMDVLIQCIDGQAEIGLTGKIKSGWEAQQALGEAMSSSGLARISLRARDYAPYEPLLTGAPFIKTFGPLAVELAPGSFLQPSAEGEAALLACVMNAAIGATKVADLFCGHGTFTGPLMEKADVAAYDSATDAITALRRAGVNASRRDLFKEPLTQAELSALDCVILDPPRTGAKAQTENVAASRVERVIYVSCNPQSLARDARILIDGGYSLEIMALVDQFIWSPHTEVVAVFSKN